MPVVPEDPFGRIKDPSKPGLAPDPKVVNHLHARSDVDTSTEAQHHTLGNKANQSSPGDHIHDGRSSKRLLEDIILVGSTATYNQSLFQQVINALEQLGATDSTS